MKGTLTKRILHFVDPPRADRLVLMTELCSIVVHPIAVIVNGTRPRLPQARDFYLRPLKYNTQHLTGAFLDNESVNRVTGQQHHKKPASQTKRRYPGIPPFGPDLLWGIRLSLTNAAASSRNNIGSHVIKQCNVCTSGAGPLATLKQGAPGSSEHR